MTQDEATVLKTVREMTEARVRTKHFPFTVKTSDLSHNIPMDGKRMKAALNGLFKQGLINARHTINGLTIELL